MFLKCDSPQFRVEAHKNFVPNAVSFQLALGGGRQWYIAGFYLSLGDALTIKIIVTAIGQFPRVTDLMVAGNFNSDLTIPKVNAWGEEIAVALVDAGLEEMLAPFSHTTFHGHGTEGHGV